MKYKECPHCNTHNSPSAFECIKCYADLISARVVDEEIENASEKKTQSVKRSVRICSECGLANPANARKCQRCNEDISDVKPSEENDDVSNKYELVSLDGQFVYEVQEGTTVIGREETLAEYLLQMMYVSRRHAEFSLKNGKLTVINLSRSNYTYVNNKRYITESVELHDGDEVGLGGNCINNKRQSGAAYFVVRTRTCT